MAVSKSYVDFVLETLSGAGEVVPRRMFSGVGLYTEDAIFALILNDQLYFKVSERTAERYRDAGAEPFLYTNKTGRTVAMPYYQAPDFLFDDPDEMTEWARDAMVVGLAAKVAK